MFIELWLLVTDYSSSNRSIVLSFYRSIVPSDCTTTCSMLFALSFSIHLSSRLFYLKVPDITLY